MTRSAASCVLAIAAGVAHADPRACASHADADAAALDHTNGLRAHKIGGITLGEPRAHLVGFSCDDDRCVKIVDPRCKTARCSEAHGHFAIDGAEAPLDHLAVALTRSDACLVYAIEYTFALTQPVESVIDSMVASYGPPTANALDGDGGCRVSWHENPRDFDAATTLDCAARHCRLETHAGGIVQVERERQALPKP